MRLLLCVIILLFLSSVAHAEVLLIANSSVKETTLTRKDIKDIFLGKKKYWKDSSKITVATLKPGNVNSDFVTSYLSISPKQYASHLEKGVFTTPGQPPKQFTSSRKRAKYVETTAGAIGYIDSKTKAENVVVLNVD
jgi:ABC-type phosphate transport system substrate-binding protein